MHEAEAAHAWKLNINQIEPYAVSPGNLHSLLRKRSVQVLYSHVVESTLDTAGMLRIVLDYQNARHFPLPLTVVFLRID